MGLFSDPALEGMKAELSGMQQQYRQMQGQLAQMHDQFLATLTRYRTYTIYNSALVTLGSALKMDPDQFAGMLTKFASPPPGLGDNNIMSPDLRDELKTRAGGDYIINAIYEFHKAIEDPQLSSSFDTFCSGVLGVSDVLQGLEAGGLGVIPSTDSIPGPLRMILSLPLQAVAFAASAVLDFVMGPFEDMEEERELSEAMGKCNQAINTLGETMSQVMGATQELVQGIATQQTLFAKVLKQLNVIVDVGVHYQLSPTETDQTYWAAQSDAVNAYGVIFTIRHQLNNMIIKEGAVNANNMYPMYRDVSVRSLLPYRDMTADQMGKLMDFVHSSIPTSTKT
jgi:hypothetical protein